MPRVLWPLRRGRPSIEMVLTPPHGAPSLPRVLLSDTGAGGRRAPFDLILDRNDCRQCGGFPHAVLRLGGAYAGLFPVYRLSVRLPALGFAKILRAVGVSSNPPGFDGIACFGLLNQFTYGNFGDPSQFGLEC